MPRKKRNTFKYTVVDKKTYQTDTCGILFKLKINGVEADGSWGKTYSYTHDGVDVNEIDLNGKRIKIFNGGGSYRTHEI